MITDMTPDEIRLLRDIAQDTLMNLDRLGTDKSDLSAVAKLDPALAALATALREERAYVHAHPEEPTGCGQGTRCPAARRELRQPLKRQLRPAAQVAQKLLAQLSRPVLRPGGPRWALAHRAAEVMIHAPWVRGVALFRSVACGEDRETSDIDLWIDGASACGHPT